MPYAIEQYNRMSMDKRYKYMLQLLAGHKDSAYFLQYASYLVDNFFLNQ